jgi:hypothetical protein
VLFRRFAFDVPWCACVVCGVCGLYVCVVCVVCGVCNFGMNYEQIESSYFLF